MPKEFNPEHARANGYTRADWDAVNAPEISDADLAGAKPFRTALPDLADRIDKEIARRGRPPLDNPKVAVNIRFDPDLLERLKAGGKGWQSRANEMLRKAVGL